MLVRLFAKPPTAIRTQAELVPLTLNLDTALPLGLLANELITNVLKHAFVGRSEGTLFLKLELTDDGFRLTVADDGVGIPPDFDLSSGKTLGMRMIAALTGQLHGKVSVLRQGLNSISLAVPLRTPCAVVERTSL